MDIRNAPVTLPPTDIVAITNIATLLRNNRAALRVVDPAKSAPVGDALKRQEDFLMERMKAIIFNES